MRDEPEADLLSTRRGAFSFGARSAPYRTGPRPFGQGEALVAGKIASHPALVRFGSRISHEGGADVAGWA